MFRFDFDGEQTVHSSSRESLSSPYEALLATNNSIVEVFPQPLTLTLGSLPLVKVFDFEIVKSTSVSSEGGEFEYDLLPGTYEGCHALWEASIDLCAYLKEVYTETGVIADTVLELGCGAGLPGIQALRLGSHRVVFSDFNEDVLVSKTWPNIQINAPQLSNQQAFCLAGDWPGLPAYFAVNSDRYSHCQPSRARLTSLRLPCSFDLILSAETLYSAESCLKIVLTLESLLSDTGVAIIANKRYYFGVGGGTQELKRIVASRAMSLRVVRVIEDGVSNIREVICISRTNASDTR